MLCKVVVLGEEGKHEVNANEVQAIGFKLLEITEDCAEFDKGETLFVVRKFNDGTYVVELDHPESMVSARKNKQNSKGSYVDGDGDEDDYGA